MDVKRLQSKGHKRANLTCISVQVALKVQLNCLAKLNKLTAEIQRTSSDYSLTSLIE